MKHIKKFVNHIDEELAGAEEYAEKYIEYKANGDAATSDLFKKMANDELNHAIIVHDLAVKEIEKINKIFVAPADMQKKWEESHMIYVEKSSWIKQMLSM